MSKSIQEHPQPDPRQIACQWAALLESSDDAIIGLTLERMICTWNRGATLIFGCEVDEALGRPLALIVAPEAMREAEAKIEKVLRGEGMPHFETFHIFDDGRRVDVEMSLAPVLGEGGVISGALLIGRNLAARKRAAQSVTEMEDSAWQRAVLLETANHVAQDILASRTGVEALRHIAEAARLLVDARFAALGVAYLDPRPGALRLREFITVGLTSEEEAVIGARPKGHGVLGLLLERTEPLRIDRLTEHPASAGLPPNHPPMQAFLGVPIRRGEEVLGSLYLTDKQNGQPFTEADEVAVQALAANAAVAIHHLHLLSRQRALVSGLMTAQEEERRAIAYDLHDGLTQYVMASYAHLEAFQYADASGQEEVAARELSQGLKYLKEAVTESRRLVNNLRLLALEDLGLSGSLEQLLEQEKIRAGWEDAEIIHNLSGRRFESALETGVYRIAQEALTNARKHAQTARVRLMLLAETTSLRGDMEEHLRLEVRDWGCGFVPEQQGWEIVGETDHVGLQGIIERAHLLGGTYEMKSTLGQGTTLIADFPILEAAISKVAPQITGEML